MKGHISKKGKPAAKQPPTQTTDWECVNIVGGPLPEEVAGEPCRIHLDQRSSEWPDARRCGEADGKIISFST